MPSISCITVLSSSIQSIKNVFGIVLSKLVYSVFTEVFEQPLYMYPKSALHVKIEWSGMGVLASSVFRILD